MFSVSDRYVFIEWLKAFVMVLGATFSLFVLFEIQDKFPTLLSYNASAREIFTYFAVLAPSFLTILLPASILVSILYALGLLHRGNEFIAFRAAGMSVFRVTRSIWMAAAVISAVLWYLNSTLIPWSVEQSEALMTHLMHEKQAEEVAAEEIGIVEAVAFDDRKKNHMWFINRYSEYYEQAYGISISIMNEERQLLRKILARRGYYDPIEGHWTLFEGRDIQYDLEDDELTRMPPFEKMEAENLTADPELMLLFSKRPKDLSFLQLKRIADNFTRDENPAVLGYEARLHALMASAASCLIVAGIAIPFAISGVRTNPAVGVSKSIGLFFGFYIMTSVLNAMGREGTLSPEVAAWAPMAFMIGLAYVLVRRVR